MRAPPGTPSTTRAVQPPAASTDPTSSSGGRGTPARRQTRPNARSRAGTAEPPMASMVSRQGRPRGAQGARALGVQVDPVPGDGPRSAGAVHGEGELVALGDELGGGAPRGGEAHPTPSPSVRSIGRSAWITKAMCSSSGTPSSSAPWRTSSRFTPRANALSLSFFFTEATSRSPQLLDGRTSAQATRKPHSSSTANNAFAIVVSRGTPL